MIVKLKDENGINTTGNGIGHDLIAIIDENTDSQIILNDFYQANQDSFNSGIVRYQLEDLAVGNHTLKIRAWDIANNVSESTLDFTVVSNEKLTIDHVLPLSKGNGLKPGNAVVMCLSCNANKNNKLLDEIPKNIKDRLITKAEEFKQYWENNHDSSVGSGTFR